MVKKLTMKTWVNTGILLVFCLGMSIAMLWRYAPSALALLQGRTPLLEESTGNIYGISALGLFFLVISIFMFVRQLTNSVGKRVNRFLEEHPEANMAQLDQEFSGAEKIGDLWIGSHRTFSHELYGIVVENTEIVSAYVEKERSKGNTSYYICLDLKSGKTERVKMYYSDLSKVLEQYRKYPGIRVQQLQG